MQTRHIPAPGGRYWTALCIASIFGANMGDFFARILGLGHIRGLPFLAVGLAMVFFMEARDKRVHEAWYWLAIIVVRTAATNIADLGAGDLKMPREWLALGLAVLLVASVWVGRTIASGKAGLAGDKGTGGMPTTDVTYWTSMLVAGTLGTVIGDYTAGNSGLGLGLINASLALSLILSVWFFLGRSVLLKTAAYWFTVVLVRAAGTVVGDLLANRTLGINLAPSTLVSGLVFIAVLIFWKSTGPRRSNY